MIPLMAALLITSVASGQLVSRTGRYKALPMIGMVLVAASLFLLSTMTPDMAVWVICSYLALMGLGLGMSMQILILIVQNTFPNSEVGTATASNNYFRQIGASLGSAIVGSLFVAKLTQLLTENMPAGGNTADGGSNSLTPAVVRDLPAPLRDVIVNAYNDALTPIFLYMVPLVIVGFVLLFFVIEKPLATSIERDILPESLEIDGGTWELLESDQDRAAGALPEPLCSGSR